jgi:hypothetical protein
MIKTKVVSAGGITLTIGKPAIRPTRDFEEAYQKALETKDDYALAEAMSAYVLAARDRSGVVQPAADLLGLNIQELMDLHRQVASFTYVVEDPATGKPPSP